MRIHCCKDCHNREVGCHVTCEKYIQEKADIDKLRQQIDQSKTIERFVTDRRMEKRSRLIKKYGKSTV